MSLRVPLRVCIPPPTINVTGDWKNKLNIHMLDLNIHFLSALRDLTLKNKGSIFLNWRNLQLDSKYCKIGEIYS